PRRAHLYADGIPRSNIVGRMGLHRRDSLEPAVPAVGTDPQLDTKSREIQMVLSRKPYVVVPRACRPRLARPALYSSLGAVLALWGSRAWAQPFSVRDSAGIRIASNAARSAAPVAFKLADKPLIRVGGLENDPDVELNSRNVAMTGVRLASGGFVVAERVRLQFFDANSKRLKILGSHGAGPQEFQRISYMCRTHGDTLVILDDANGRLAIVDGRKMEFVRTIPTMHYGDLVENACFEDGTFLMVHQAGPTAPVQHLYRLRIDGTLVTDLGDFPRPHGETLAPVFVRFNAFGNQFVLGNTLTNDVQFYSPTGKLTRIVRSSDVPVRTTDSELRAIATRHVPDPNMPASQRTALINRWLSQTQLKYWPPHFLVLSDGTGGVWVQDYIPGRNWNTAPWTAFDSSGKLTGRLVIPEAPKGQFATWVTGFGPNEILLRTYDADGAAYLSVYPLVQVTKN
ncbi:MAG: hypothetical protein ABJB74_03300, partial [Gemmatimonas sp.]